MDIEQNKPTMELIKEFRMKDVWNNATMRPDRPTAPRDYCYASELSRPLIDRYLSMKGVEPTNRPNLRARRKMLAGNFFEEIQGIIISTLGLRVDLQEVVECHEALLVRGKIDFLIQGVPDYERARFNINKLPFSAEMIYHLQSVVDTFEQKIGNREFAPMIRECKSCSEFVIDLIQDGGEIIGHKLQLYHYLRGKNIPVGFIDYLSKQDGFMEDSKVEYPDTRLETRYLTDLSDLKGYLDANQLPPPAPKIIWEKKFKRNFNIEYSNFLTKIYGYKEPLDYYTEIQPIVTQWNRVLSRVKDVQEGKRNKPTRAEPLGALVKLTDANKVVIQNIEKSTGMDVYLIAKEAQVEENVEE